MGAVDHDALVAGLRDWLSEHAAELAPFRSEPAGPIEDAFALERRFQRLLFDAGWSRWGWPEECGGVGGDPVLRSVVIDAIGAEGYYFPEVMLFLGIIGSTLLHFAPGLAARHLPPALRGDEGWCQGFSEPDAGSDLASLRTRAEATPGGYRINGQKVWSSHGHMATWCLVLARTGTTESRHRGLTMFWVDLRTPGLTVRPIACANDRNELAELFFDDVEVPREHVVGEIDGGWAVAMYLLQFERGNYAWQRQAWMLRCLEDAAARANERGPLTAAAVGNAYLTILALRARCRDTTLRLARGEQLGAKISVDKVLLSTAEREMSDAIRAMAWPDAELGDSDHAASVRREWFYSRTTSIYGGAVEVQRDLLAERIVGLPRET